MSGWMDVMVCIHLISGITTFYCSRLGVRGGLPIFRIKIRNEQHPFGCQSGFLMINDRLKYSIAVNGVRIFMTFL